VAPAWQAALLRALARVWPGFTMKVALPGRLLSRDPEVARAYEADPLVHWSRSASLALEGLLAVERVRASTGPLRTPALFLHGEEDPIAPVAAVRAFVSALPPGDHTLRVYPGGLHEPHNDLDHATVLADVVRWLGKRG